MFQAHRLLVSVLMERDIERERERERERDGERMREKETWPCGSMQRGQRRAVDTTMPLST